MKYIILVSVCIFSTACSIIPDSYQANVLFNQGSDLLDNSDKKIDVVDQKALEDRVSAVNNYLTRNQLIDELLSISDRSCSRHHALIMANANSWNVSTGTLSTFLSVVGTVTGGETTKAALSAGAAFTNSTRSLVNEEIYAQAIGSTIVRASMSAREKQLAEIEVGMREQDIQVYSIQQGLRDVYNYHDRCSFYYGILEITQAIENRKRTSSEIVNSLDSLKAEAQDAVANQRSAIRLNERIEALSLELENAPN